MTRREAVHGRSGLLARSWFIFQTACDRLDDGLAPMVRLPLHTSEMFQAITETMRGVEACVVKREGP